MIIGKTLKFVTLIYQFEFWFNSISFFVLFIHQNYTQFDFYMIAIHFLYLNLQILCYFEMALHNIIDFYISIFSTKTKLFKIQVERTTIVYWWNIYIILIYFRTIWQTSYNSSYQKIHCYLLNLNCHWKQVISKY